MQELSGTPSHTVQPLPQSQLLPSLCWAQTWLCQSGEQSQGTQKWLQTQPELCCATEKHLRKPLRQAESKSPRREKHPVLVIKIP